MSLEAIREAQRLCQDAMRREISKLRDFHGHPWETMEAGWKLRTLVDARDVQLQQRLQELSRDISRVKQEIKDNQACMFVDVPEEVRYGEKTVVTNTFHKYCGGDAYYIKKSTVIKMNPVTRGTISEADGWEGQHN